MEALPLVFCADRRYLPHFATAVISFLENNPGSHRIFLVSPDLTDDDLTELRDLVSSAYESTLELIRIDKESLEGFYVSGHLSPAAYVRLFLPEILPQEISKVIYLDSDLLVLGDLLSPVREALEYLQPSNQLPCVLWAVTEGDGAHLRPFGFTSRQYFNSGVMVLDLDGWRSENATQELVSLAKSQGSQLSWWDQDVLNLYFQDRWRLLPERLNSLEGKNPSGTVVVHFNSQMKPWHVGYRGEAGGLYRDYREITPFALKVQFSFRAIASAFVPQKIGIFIKRLKAGLGNT